MKVGVNEIRVGNVLEYSGDLCVVTDREHIKPGKGGAYLQIEMRSIKNGTKLKTRLSTSDTVFRATIEEAPCSVLFQDNDSFTVMLGADNDYEQKEVKKSLVEKDKLPFIQDGMEISLEMYNGEALSVSLPRTLKVKIDTCEPFIKGQTVSSSYKPAVLENGVKVMVPQFIGAGEEIIVNLANEKIEYLERAK